MGFNGIWQKVFLDTRLVICLMSRPRNLGHHSDTRILKWNENGALEYNLTSDNVFKIHGAIFAKWGALGYAQSDLGLPIIDQGQRIGEYCEFEGGNISWNTSENDYIVKLNNVDSTIKVGQGAPTSEITQLFIDA